MQEEISFDGFSCPQMRLSPDLLRLIVVGHARAVTEAFVDRHQDLLAARSDGLVPLLRSWTRGEDEFSTVWDLAFGDLCAELLHGSEGRR